MLADRYLFRELSCTVGLMNISLSFVEYDAVTGLQGLSELGFMLVSKAKLSSVDNKRMWIVEGTAAAFEALRMDIVEAKRRFLRKSVLASVSDITKTIDDALESAKAMVTTYAQP